VMAIVLMMILQITNGILGATLAQRQQMDSVAAARRALDVLSVDLEHAVAGNTAAILAPDAASTNLLCLLTTRGGPVGTAGHRFLAVRYSTNSAGQLFRSYGSANYTSANLLQAAATAATNSPSGPLASGILQIRLLALGDGANSYPLGQPPAPHWSTNSYNGLTPPSGYKALIGTQAAFAAGLTNRTRALEAWVAAVDSQNLGILATLGKTETVRSALLGDPTAWREQVDNADIPPTCKSGIRILKKTIPIP
jgi:hypothetical protein